MSASHDRTPAGRDRHLPRVFVRQEALELERPDERHGRRSTLAPDAERALETLAIFGYEIVVLPPGTGEVDMEPRDWLLTGDASDCRWARRLGARTVLVGADAAAQASRPERCDLTVNSLYGAAIEMVMDVPAGGPSSGER